MSMQDVIKEKVSAAVDIVVNYRPTPKALLRGAAYLSYGVLVFAVVFAAKFYVRQTDELVRQGVAGVEGVIIEFPYLEPQIFPPRVTLEYLRVIDQKTGKLIVSLKDADIKLSALSLLMGKGAVSIDCRMFGGLVRANISTGFLFDIENVKLALNMEMVELQKIQQVQAYDKSLKGYASVDAELSGKWTEPLSMDGFVISHLAQLDLDNRFPVIKGPRINGFSIDLNCAMEQGVWIVSQLDILGESGIALKVSGSIALDQQNFSNSTLDMNGVFKGDPKLLATSILDPKAVDMLNKKQSLPVSLKGPLNGPAINLQ